MDKEESKIDGLILGYYNKAFLIFLKSIADEIKLDSSYLRNSFWSLIIDGHYFSSKAQELFYEYAKSLELKAKNIIEKYSFAYWIHLTRRIGVSSGGVNKEPGTIFSNRFNILVLIQKYGRSELCGHVGVVKDINISQVFNGLLLDPDFEPERFTLEREPNQLVFTDFDQNNLLEYYTLENIAYEIWVCCANLRAIGKGAVIVVDHSLQDYFFRVPVLELENLLESYDSRSDVFNSSQTGTVFTNEFIDGTSEIFIPYLNVGDVDIRVYNKIFKHVLNFQIYNKVTSNYLMFPFPIKKYLIAHFPFVEDFKNGTGIDFRTILFCIGSLCVAYYYKFVVEKQPSFISIMFRGYEGPYRMSDITKHIYNNKEITENILDYKFDINGRKIELACKYLTLENKKSVTYYDFGSLKLFVKAFEDRYYIDYSIIPTILLNLFNSIDLNKHNFRGKTLEDAIGTVSYLPTKPCKSLAGTQKQIDFSFKFEDILIIAECKVVAKKPGYFSGSILGIEHRKMNVIEKGLHEVNEKAVWLKKNPNGTNYNLIGIKYILPVAISPFVEFIHSLNEYYWINNAVPRVLSLSEFMKFIETLKRDEMKFNLLDVSL